MDENNPAKRKYTITAEQIVGLTSYLQKQPWEEVNPLIVMLTQLHPSEVQLSQGKVADPRSKKV